MPSTSPVERISGPSSGSTSGNMVNGKTASLTPKWGTVRVLEVQVARASCPASAAWRGGPSGWRRPWRPAARCARRGGWPPARRPCPCRWRTGCSSRPTTSSSLAMRRVYSSIVSRCCWRDADRRDHAGGVAGVDAGVLDVLHDRRDEDVLAVGEGVGLGLDGVLQEAVDEDGPVGRDADRRGDVQCAARPRRGRSPCRARRARRRGGRSAGSRCAARPPAPPPGCWPCRTRAWGCRASPSSR